MNGVVLISGSGSNLQSIIDTADEISLSVKCVISSKSDAYGLQRASEANIPNCSLDHELYNSREDYDSALIKLIDVYQPEVIILAGFMRVLSSQFIEKYQGKILNIHPSLLPKYPGLNTHQRAIDAGEATHGASVHFVTNTLDGGPVVCQQEVIIQAEEDAKTLGSRVLKQEHILYPKAIHWFTQGRLKQVNDTTATLDDQII